MKIEVRVLVVLSLMTFMVGLPIALPGQSFNVRIPVGADLCVSLSYLK